jgi:uncharacterized YccA/Bax inhibitor family protein
MNLEMLIAVGMTFILSLIGSGVIAKIVATFGKAEEITAAIEDFATQVKELLALTATVLADGTVTQDEVARIIKEAKDIEESRKRLFDVFSIRVQQKSVHPQEMLRSNKKK